MSFEANTGGPGSSPSSGPNSGSNSGPPAPPQRPAFLAVFPSIMLPMFLAVLDQTIVATALPSIAAATGEVERASWVVVSYLIASTIAAPIYGRLGDAFGRRRLMFVALAVFIAASLLCAASTSILLLTLARLLQGLGGGGLMTLPQALVGEAFPPRERARYQGYLAAVAVCANTFGPVAGGYLTQHFGWRSVFLVNLPIGLIGVLLTRKLENRVPEKSDWRPDPLGLLWFTIFVTTTLLTLEQAQHVDRGAVPLLGGLFAAGVVSLALLVRQESRAPSPLIPLSLLGLLTIGIGTGSLLTGRLVSKTGRTTVFPVFGLALATATLVVLAASAQALSTT